jgi:hypothetical protein
VLTSWIVSLDIPAGVGERKLRPATIAIRRHRRVVEVRPVSSSIDAESGQAKAWVKGGSTRIGPRESESGHGIGPGRRDPWAPRLKRVRATLARARAIQDWLDADSTRKAADVARREHVTRARISQLLLLLKLSAEIRADIQQPGRTGAVLGELELRMLAPLPAKEQVRRYRALLGLDAPVDGESPRTAAKSVKRHQHGTTAAPPTRDHPPAAGRAGIDEGLVGLS